MIALVPGDNYLYAATVQDSRCPSLFMGCGLCAKGYGLWAMGYGLWAMGYGLLLAVWAESGKDTLFVIEVSDLYCNGIAISLKKRLC